MIFYFYFYISIIFESVYKFLLAHGSSTGGPYPDRGRIFNRLLNSWNYT